MPSNSVRFSLFAAIATAVSISPALAASPSLTLSATTVAEGDRIVITVANANNPPRKLDWVGLYEEGIVPSGQPPSIWYRYLGGAGITSGSGSLTFDPATIESGARHRYGSGKYQFILAYDDGYRVEAKAAFTVAADRGAYTGANPFFLLSSESSKAMNLSGLSSDDYTPVILWTYDGSSNEEWRLVPSGQKDWFYIVSRLNYKTIAVDPASGRVRLLAKGSGDSYLWKLERAGGDSVRIISKLNGKYLDTENSGRDNSVQLQLGKGQAWTVKTNAMGEEGKARTLLDESTRLYAEGKVVEAAASLSAVVEGLEKQYPAGASSGSADKPPAFMATCYSRLEDLLDEASAFDKVLALYGRAIARFPDLVQDSGFVGLAAEADVWQGSIALGKGDYVRARGYYDAADELRKTNPSLAKEADWLNLAFMRDIANKRYALGATTPEAVQDLLVLYYRDETLTVTDDDGSSRIVTNHLRQKDRDRSEIIQGVMARVLETWSGGKFSLAFRRVEVPVVLQGFFTWSDAGGSTRYCEPDLYNVSDEAAQAKVMLDNLGWADSLLIYWDKKGLYEEYFGFGGATGSYPVMPYQLKIPWRGFVEMPARLSGPGSISFLLHEYFHTVEDAWSIWPRHGYTEGNRASFPDWKGEGQLDYYRWHFTTTIPAKIATAKNEGKPATWARACFALDYPFLLTAGQLEKNRAAVAKLPFADRIGAYDAYKEAEKARKAGDRTQATKLYAEVERLNPSYPELHWTYGDFAVEAKDYAKAAKEYGTYLDLSASPEVALTLAGIYETRLSKPGDAETWYRRYADYAVAAAANAEARGAYQGAASTYADYADRLLAAGRLEMAIQLADRGIALADGKRLTSGIALARCIFARGEGLLPGAKREEGAALMKKALGMGLEANASYAARAKKISPATLALAGLPVSRDGKIVITLKNGNDPAHGADWVGLYEDDVVPGDGNSSIWYVYLKDAGISGASGSLTFDPAAIASAKRSRYKAGGSYKFVLAYDDGYGVEATARFSVK